LLKEEKRVHYCKELDKLVKFNPELTEMIFFDLEFYVPKEERDKPGASLLSNPCKENQFLLGGVFTRYHPLKDRNPDFDFKHFWIWKQKEEKNVLNSIYQYFQESWAKLKDKDPRHADLILCGIGISRFDVPILYIRSVLNGIDSSQKIFECYFKTKQVDLSNVCIAFFRNDRYKVMYPKTSNQMLRYLDIGREKISGMNVWELYDSEDFANIERRTESEVKDCIEIYKILCKRIYGRY